MNGYTVSDPSDFTPTGVPKLFELDSLLRCHICKEFLQAPMLTHCGHSFCSVCIRKYLIHTPQCPICSKELREASLQRNILLEQVVVSFRGVRDDLLEKLKVVKKEARVRAEDVTEVQVIEINDDDLEIVYETTRKRKVDQHSHGLDALFKRRKSPDQMSDTTVKMAPCPICSKQFPLDKLESEHIDICLNTPLLQSDSPQTFTPKEVEHSYQKLTKLDFAGISTNSLKQKLTKLELPTTGTRNQLEQRYNEYLIIWNANCDSIQPKNPKVLRKQVAQWEASLKFKQSENATQLDGQGWKDLIKQARSGLKKKMKQNDENDNDDTKEHSVEPENEVDKEIDTIDIISTNEDDFPSAQPTAGSTDQVQEVSTQSSEERFFQ